MDSRLDVKFTNTGGNELTAILQQVTSISQQASIATQQLTQQIQLLNLSTKENGIGVYDLNQSLNNLSSTTKNLSSATAGNIATNKESGMSFGELALRVAGYSVGIGAAIQVTRQIAQEMINLAKQSIDLAGTFEMARIQWGVLIGDMEQGASMFDKIYGFAVRTPYTFSSSQTAALELKAFGVAAEDVMTILQKLGDMAMGDNNRLALVAKSYGEMFAMGNVQARNLIQMVRDGIPIYEALAQALNTNTENIVSMTRKVNIGIEDVNKAIDILTEKGGLFSGMLSQVEQTYKGKLNIAKGEWEVLLSDMATGTGPLFLGVVANTFNDFLDNDWSNNLVRMTSSWQNMLKEMLDEFNAWALTVSREHDIMTFIKTGEGDPQEILAALDALKKQNAADESAGTFLGTGYKYNLFNKSPTIENRPWMPNYGEVTGYSWNPVYNTKVNALDLNILEQQIQKKIEEKLALSAEGKRLGAAATSMDNTPPKTAESMENRETWETYLQRRLQISGLKGLELPGSSFITKWFDTYWADQFKNAEGNESWTTETKKDFTEEANKILTDMRKAGFHWWDFSVQELLKMMDKYGTKTKKDLSDFEKVLMSATGFSAETIAGTDQQILLSGWLNRQRENSLSTDAFSKSVLNLFDKLVNAGMDENNPMMSQFRTVMNLLVSESPAYYENGANLVTGSLSNLFKNSPANGMIGGLSFRSKIPTAEEYGKSILENYQSPTIYNEYGPSDVTDALNKLYPNKPSSGAGLMGYLLPKIDMGKQSLFGIHLLTPEEQAQQILDAYKVPSNQLSVLQQITGFNEEQTSGKTAVQIITEWASKQFNMQSLMWGINGKTDTGLLDLFSKAIESLITSGQFTAQSDVVQFLQKEVSYDASVILRRMMAEGNYPSEYGPNSILSNFPNYARDNMGFYLPTGVQNQTTGAYSFTSGIGGSLFGAITPPAITIPSSGITAQDLYEAVNGKGSLDKLKSSQMVYPEKPTLPSEYGVGNIDLNNRPIVHNADGSISTVYSMTFWPDDEIRAKGGERSPEDKGKYILVPGVRAGLNRTMTEEEAWDYYLQTGEYLGKFKSDADAEAYAQSLHEKQADIYAPYANGTIPTNAVVQQEYTNALNPNFISTTNREKLLAGQANLLQNKDNMSTEGFKEQWQKLKEQYDTATSFEKLLKDNVAQTAIEGMATGLERVGKALANSGNSAGTFKNAIKEMIESIAQLIPKLELQAGLQLLTSSNFTNPVGWTLVGLGLAGSLGSGLLEGSGSSSGTSLTTNAKGGVYSSPSLGQYLNGIYDTPHVFAFANGGIFSENYQKEGIFPVTQTSDGSLGVKAVGLGTPNVSIEVKNMSSVSVSSKTTQTTDAAGNKKIILMLNDMVDKKLQSAGVTVHGAYRS
ncbi:MAG: tape measure protein [Smithella sp.]